MSAELPQTDDFYRELLPQYIINRRVLTHSDLLQQTGYRIPEKSIIRKLVKKWRRCDSKKFLKSYMPIAAWLPDYSIPKYFIGDLMAGVTIAVMNISQGLAYGILAGVPVNVGFYTAIFPVLAYIFFGTSRHASIGPNAIISLMTSDVIQRVTTEFQKNTEPLYTPLHIITSMAMTVGIMFVILGLLGFGKLGYLLNEPLVNGLTIGAGIQVIFVQITDMLGLSQPLPPGKFKLYYILSGLFPAVKDTNFYTVTFAFGVLSFMLLATIIVAPWFIKKYHLPLPTELMAITGGILITKVCNVGDDIKKVGPIPTGLPWPSLPYIELMPIVLLDSIAIAIVSFSLDISIVTTIARKHHYDIPANQEIFALGVSNIFGSIYSCIPLACSLSRTLEQERVGGCTQLASLITVLLLIIVVYWIAPCFEILPRCVLAAVIVFILQATFSQVKEIKRFRKQGKLETATWLCTFLGVIFIGIEYGLAIGFLVSLYTFYAKGLRANSSLLGTLPGTGIYVDIRNHKNVSEVPHMKIYRYAGPLNFATKQLFKKRLYRLIRINRRKIVNYIKRSSLPPGKRPIVTNYIPFRTVIIDLSSVHAMDIAGCKILQEISIELAMINVRLFLTGPIDRVYLQLLHHTNLGHDAFDILPTIHDAVLYAGELQIDSNISTLDANN